MHSKSDTVEIDSDTRQQVDPELSEELFELSLATNGDTVEGEVESVQKYGTGGTIRVRVRLPTGKTYTEGFDYPTSDSTDHKFVRLVRQCGFSLGAVEHLAGCTVDCRHTDGGWEIVSDRSAQHRARQAAETALATVATPLWLPWGLYLAMRNDSTVEDGFEYMLFSTCVLVVWVVSGALAFAIMVGLLT